MKDFDSYVRDNEWVVRESLRFGYSNILSMAGLYASGDAISVELRPDGVSIVTLSSPPYEGEGSWRFGDALSDVVINNLSPEPPVTYDAISGGTFTRDVRVRALVGPFLGDGMRPILERR